MTNTLIRLPLLIRGLATVLVITSSARADDPEETEATRRLKARAPEFREEVIKVSDGVYSAVGYSVSNSSMIVGDDGVIIIDTGMDSVRAEAILEQFRKITDKPIAAVIFTHGHGDHTGGASVFVEEGDEPQVWARSNFG